ncbi:MAG: sensor histidine kinase [Chloroflexota bacterium]
MKTFAARYLPILLVFAVETIALDFAARANGRPVYQTVTIFSAIAGTAILVTGLLPALVRPSNIHSLIACFTIVFGSLLLIPFEFTDLPQFQPQIPTYQFLTLHLLLRLINGAVLLGMAIHLSARFPRLNPKISSRFLLIGYLIPFFILIPLLLSSSSWLRITSTILLFLYFTFVILFFIWNLLFVARDTTSENIRQTQQARIILASTVLAETILWLRPLALTLGFVIPYDLVLATQLFIPAGIAYAILRHELFGINRVLRRTLIYGALSLALLTIYLGMTTAFTAFFQDNPSRPLAPFFGLLVAGALFEPTRRGTQKWLDRLLYPDRLKFMKAIQSVQTSLARANRRDEIASLLTSDLPRQIGAEWAALTFFPKPDVPPAKQSAPAWNSRLVAGNVTFGGYWLGPRRAGPHYDTEERSRLQTLLQQAALALAYANAYESLYQLNQNLEARVQEQTANALESQKEVAAYQERQRIARELHDSVTQDIFGLHLTARGLRKSAPEPLKKEIGELESLASDVLRQMRLLLNQLRNPSGGETVDLTEAIRSQCDALAHKTGPEGGPLLTVEVELPEALEIPSAIAEEALWVVREALQNVIRHSDCRNAKLVARADDMLCILIEDAGKGFDMQAVPAGHYGLRGMRERVLALGGEFKIDSETGRGTILSFSLPLPKAFKHEVRKG